MVILSSREVGRSSVEDGIVVVGRICVRFRKSAQGSP